VGGSPGWHRQSYASRTLEKSLVASGCSLLLWGGRSLTLVHLDQQLFGTSREGFFVGVIRQSCGIEVAFASNGSREDSARLSRSARPIRGSPIDYLTLWLLVTVGCLLFLKTSR